MTTAAPNFELENVGAGPDPFALSNVDAEFLVLFFQRDHYCTNCRSQVQQVAENYDEFRERDAEVVSIVPEPAENVHEWQQKYDLPYPLLADPEAEAGDAYDQPVRFGVLGRFSDFLGRMPVVAILDLRGEEPTLAESHVGRSTFDRPDVESLLDELDALRDG